MICPSCGTDQMTYEVMQPMEPAKPLGMKWYNFVIWVQLFLSALRNIIQGVILLSGRAEGLEKEQWEALYAEIDGLHTVVIMMGLTSIILGIFALVVRHFLTQFMEKGPLLYIIYQVVYVVLIFIDAIALASVLGIPVAYMLESAEIWGEITIYAVLIFVNSIYFHKRKDMFVF